MFAKNIFKFFQNAFSGMFILTHRRITDQEWAGKMLCKTNIFRLLERFRCEGHHLIDGGSIAKEHDEPVDSQGNTGSFGHGVKVKKKFFRQGEGSLPPGGAQVVFL